MENLSEILNWVFGGTSLIGVVTTIAFWRKSKRKEEADTQIKEAEAMTSHLDVQRQEMELADLYKQKVLEMMELLNAKQDKGNMNQDKMISMLGNIDRRLDVVEEDVGNIKGYLDGDLQKWIANKKNKMKGMKTADKNDHDHE